MWARRCEILSISAEPLSVPLYEPFVIATGRVDVTQSVLVTARVRDLATGREARGLGESAALPPVTRETQKDALFAVLSGASSLAGVVIEDRAAFTAQLDVLLAPTPVARAGVETAILDAVARLADVPLWQWLQGAQTPSLPPVLITDITIPIAAPAHMGELAAQWRQQGFTSFKVKVGRGLEQDIEALERIHLAVPDGTFRLDANAGYAETDALALMGACEDLGLRVECFEQPCGRLALEAMRHVAEAIDPPVIADESVSSLADLDRVVRAGAADGVNLKLAKSGGLLAAFEIGFAAQRAGLVLMVGSMVETRLGVTAAAHLAAGLGGVAFPDLDTAWLLKSDPFRGGYEAAGPRYVLPNRSGLAIERVSSA
jgi:L-alanine-DL-glutamate epimerase-like enolase superfamily enzyme